MRTTPEQGLSESLMTEFDCDFNRSMQHIG
jgi:hypothetical protein